MLDAHDGDKPFTHVIAGKTVILQQIFLLCIAVNAAGQGASQPRHVRTSILVANDVGVALDAFAEGIGPLKCEFNGDRTLLNLFFTGDEDGVGMERFSARIELLDEFRNPAFVMVLNLMRFVPSLVGDDDSKSCVEEGCFLQPAIDLVKIKFNDVGENGQVGLEGDGGARVIARPDGLEV